MRPIYILVILTLLFIVTTTICKAETIRIDWKYSGGVINGFTIWERTPGGKISVLDNISPEARTASFEDTLGELDCKTFFVTAYRGDSATGTTHGVPSNTAAWRKETELPPLVVRPGQVINLTITVEE